MKNKILVSIILVMFLVDLKAQENVNLVLSFRPTIGISSSLYEPGSPATSSYKNTDERKYTSLNFNLSTEINTKKDFFHFPVLAWSYLHFVSKDKYYVDDILREESEGVIDKTSLKLGYGIGKYFYIYKESVFLNFKNSIAFAYTFENSLNSSKTLDNSGNTLYGRDTKEIEPGTYGLFYELNPSMGYRIKNFSLSVGLPINLGVNFINGKQKVESYGYNNTLNTSNTTKTDNKKTSTDFNFRYELEISLRYHLPSKKK